MLLVERILQGAAALGLVHRRAHTACDSVRIENDHTIRVSRGTANGLNKTGFASEESLLIRVQNGDQADLRHIQTLTQEVDAHQHIKLAQTQVADQLHTLDGLHIVVHIAHLDPRLGEVFGEILRHFLGQRRDQHALIARRPLVDLPNEIVDLPRHGAHFDSRIEQTRGTDDLLHDLVGVVALIVRRGGGDIDRLPHPLLKLREFERAVVKRARQAEAVLHQIFLAGAVAVIHRPHLRQCDMALVHKQQEIFREIVHQRVRRRADRPPLNDARIVLDARAVAQLLHHFNIIGRALADALRLHQLLIFLEIRLPLVQIVSDLRDGALQLIPRRDIVRRRPDGTVGQNARGRAGDGVDLADAVDLIPEKLHADGFARPVGGIDLHRVAAHTEHIALKGNVISLVANVDQRAEQIVALHGHARAQGDHHFREILRLTQTVDAAHRCHDNDIPPLQQRGGGTQAQAVDLIVGGCVLFDECIGMRDIRLGLVVVVVGYEVFHSIIGEKLLELRTKLGGKGLIVRQHQRRALHRLDDLRHGEGLTRAGHAQKHLLTQTILHTLRQRGDRRRLIARGLIGRYDLKF